MSPKYSMALGIFLSVIICGTIAFLGYCFNNYNNIFANIFYVILFVGVLIFSSTFWFVIILSISNKFYKTSKEYKIIVLALIFSLITVYSVILYKLLLNNIIGIIAVVSAFVTFLTLVIGSYCVKKSDK